MTSDVPAIHVEGISKRYRIGAAPASRSLREALTSGAASTIRAALERARGGASPGDFWALDDISFEIPAGQSVGLIGHNGSGKSTLLKIISRIVAPTRGHARIHGRVGALLEVGTGFHPELSGRDNVFLNGAILGMSRAEIRRRYDQIVEFSGVEDFLSVPIKRYSSGMVMRLAFAVAAHLEPDVLIVDEVLAVGDAEFQRKCLGRMDEVARNGCTVLFVSHNLAAVQRLCRRAILLDRGRIASDGPTAEVVDRYLAETAARAEPDCWTALASPHTPVPKAAVFTAARYIDPQRPNCHPRSMGPARFEVRIAATTSMPAMLAADIADELGNKLINLDLWKINGSHADLPRGESVWRFDLEHVYLKPGRYFVTLWLATTTGSTIDYRPMALRIELASDDPMRAEGDTPNQEDGLVPCRASIVRVGEREPA